MMKPSSLIFVIWMSLTLSACSSGFTTSASLLNVGKDSYNGGSGNVNLSWNANREKAVNTSGGGYRVYYAQYSSVTDSTPFVDVPFVSGSQSPTNLRLTGLVSGTYYVHVKAYSALNPSGSDLSSASQFTVR
jgi:hypothetical protein